jgi:hypothetical protein
VRFLLSLIASLAFACTSISGDAKRQLDKPVDCGTAEQDIAALESEKASLAKQVSAGVRSVVPAAAVVGILRRDTKDRAKVATGAYNRELDAKIAEIKRSCGLDEASTP